MAGLLALEPAPGCASCSRAFDAGARAPQLLACRHHVCLTCCGALAAGRGLPCARCRPRPERGPRRPEPALAATDAELCCVHAQPALWCASCDVAACRACGGHAAHALQPAAEARALLLSEARALRHDLQRLGARRQAGLLRALDAATQLKMRLEAELAASPTGPESPREAGSLAAAAAEREWLRARYADELAQCRLDELVRQAPAPLDFELLQRALCPAGGPTPPRAAAGSGAGDPLLYLSNYCTAALFARGGGGGGRASPALSLPPELAPARPLYYFELAVGGVAAGRVVVAVRADAAPRMARNFGLLAEGGGAGGAGYAGCTVFQCWEGESVITGDVERNDGRGGRAALALAGAGGGFLPDASRLAAVRGAVGMRRSQRRHDQRGQVGSQFRIVLREMRGFSAIFGAVVEGLALVDRLSRTGDGAGKPSSSIVISSCGRLD